MSKSPLIYFKIFSFALRNHKLLEFLNLKLEKLKDSSKRKRKEEYKRVMQSEEETLSQLFPDKRFDPVLFNDLERHLDDFIEKQRHKKYPSIENPYPVDFALDRDVGRLLAYLCMYYQPEVVIETGVANGFSTSYILFGLETIGKGKLISFDYLILPWHTKEKVGLAIPNSLRHRHILKVGNAATELKQYLRNVDSIDIFLHDSSHTYKNMMEEFHIAWPHIKKGGFLLSDDVHKHDAFLDFSDEVKKTPLVISKTSYGGCFGIIQK